MLRRGTTVIGMDEFELDAPQVAWWMPQIEDRGEAIFLNGHIVAPIVPAPEAYRLAIDGQPFGGIDYMAMRPNGAADFRGMIHVPTIFKDRDEIVLRLIGAKSGTFVRDWDQFHIARPSRTPATPLPPAKLTQRAIWTDPRTFDKWGYALKRKFDAALAAYLPGPHGNHRILDWGCGAGRMAKYLTEEWAYTGIDIDKEAIAWCAANIPGGEFRLQSLEPHTEFSSNSFDAAIGISIFTHLREEDQLAWLGELSRVVRPTGVVAVSVNCGTSLHNSVNAIDVAGVLKSKGFCDSGAEMTLKGVTADDTYYRNIYHTHDYIRCIWAHDFEILDILPGFVGNMQDMVFLRPRR
jgi:SAM-dependent methyltransferase